MYCRSLWNVTGSLCCQASCKARSWGAGEAVKAQLGQDIPRFGNHSQTPAHAQYMKYSLLRILWNLVSNIENLLYVFWYSYDCLILVGLRSHGCRMCWSNEWFDTIVWMIKVMMYPLDQECIEDSRGYYQTRDTRTGTLWQWFAMWTFWWRSFPPPIPFHQTHFFHMLPLSSCQATISQSQHETIMKTR